MGDGETRYPGFDSQGDTTRRESGRKRLAVIGAVPSVKDERRLPDMLLDRADSVPLTGQRIDVVLRPMLLYSTLSLPLLSQSQCQGDMMGPPAGQERRG